MAKRLDSIFNVALLFHYAGLTVVLCNIIYLIPSVSFYSLYLFSLNYFLGWFVFWNVHIYNSRFSCSRGCIFNVLVRTFYDGWGFCFLKKSQNNNFQFVVFKFKQRPLRYKMGGVQTKNEKIDSFRNDASATACRSNFWKNLSSRFTIFQQCEVYRTFAFVTIILKVF